MSRLELPVDRLATTDADGNRLWLYPADVRGRWRGLRARVRGALVVFFLALPWLRIDGRQAVLIDVPNRRLSILGLEFWGHDLPLLLFVVAGAVLSLAFVTSIWG